MAGILPRKLRQDGEVGFGLADLSQSIFASLALPGAVNTLSLSESRRTCLLLIDGMGAEPLRQFGGEFSLFSQAKSSTLLVSHFPSTTVTNLTSLGTGELPGVHGMLGYTVRVPHSGTPGRLLNALKWDERVDPLVWQKVPTLFERATAHGITVTNIAEKRYEGSAFTQAALRGAKYVGANRNSEMVEATAIALAEPNSFTYLYINALDHAGHNDGVGSEKWLIALGQVAELISSLVTKLPRNTDLYVTADHGMVNVGEKIVLGKDNELMQNITLVGGEARARHMYVAPGALDETVAIWRELLGVRATIYTKDELIEAQLFGAVLSQDSFERMGDFIAIAHDEMILIDPSRAAQESAMVGHHGGVTKSETAIPLLKFL
jgi:predicted AlkP superfamily pyrophosphatase or phosphodiesterase